MNYILYTDGSYAQLATDRYGGGIVIIDADKNVEVLREAIEFIVMPDEIKKSKHVAAEIFTALYGLSRLAQLNKVNVKPVVKLFCDNVGLTKWYSGEWECKKLVAKIWKGAVTNISEAFYNLDIAWVRGHAKNKANELVDELASGFLMKPIKLGIIPMDTKSIEIIPETAIHGEDIDFESKDIIRIKF